MVPYLVEPMDMLASRLYTTTAIVGPGQSAKTSIGENWMLHTVAVDPAKILWYMQSDATVQAYVKDRIDPMIDSHEGLKGNLGLKAVDDSLKYKRFRRCSIEFLSANKSNLINKSAGRIIADEIDAYPEGLGDVKMLLDVRRQTFGASSMLFALSHPDRATEPDPKGWTAGIMRLYRS